MRRKRVTVLFQSIAACALWVCGMQLAQSARAQAIQDTQAEKTSKARKAKKSATDAMSPQSAAPLAEEKTAVKKHKKSAADAVSTPPTAQPAGEKTAVKKPKKSAADAVSTPPTAQPTGEKTATRRSKKAGAEATSTGSASRAQTGEEREAAPAPVSNATGADIQSAKSGGKVWVNTDSGVYHRGGRWYGATKQGQFMTEQEAIRAGYKPAKNEK
jgi:hypothetical protein